MNRVTRRSFLRSGILGAAAIAASPVVSRCSSFSVRTTDKLTFRPYPDPQMPPLGFVYAADNLEDPFKSSIRAESEGIVFDDQSVDRRFSINAKWYVKEFGYLWLSADNAGEFYTLRGEGKSVYNLNYEFARSRVARNAAVHKRYKAEGTEFSSEVNHLVALSEELCHDASRSPSNGTKNARLSDQALYYALRAGEKIELEKARDAIQQLGHRTVHFGCETRQYVWARSEEFVKRFAEVMNFATITHYVWDSWYEVFEPREGEYNWGIKDNIVNWLRERNITIQGRPLFWFHPTVTPEWLKNKTFDELKKYIDKHTHDLVTHYGDDVLQWEVFNEYHDWANIHDHTPEQITELTRRALDRTKEVNPRVVRILNNCAPWAEYAARGRMARMDATRPLRSPRRFLQDLAEAGVEYDVLGIQIYFPQRDLSDIARLLERLATFGKPIYITEIGASSNLMTQSSSGAITSSADEPYAWHRHWDEELQADWLEQVYTLYYSKPFIKAINWYDFSDFRPFIANGGLVREDSSPKQSFHRLKNLLASWATMPTQQ
jgi:endo-1,4-beta-xylanase